MTQRRVCDCGKAIRGLVPADVIDLSGGCLIDVPAHFCLQCSPGHCKMRDYCLKNSKMRYKPLT